MSEFTVIPGVDSKSDEELDALMAQIKPDMTLDIPVDPEAPPVEQPAPVEETVEASPETPEETSEAEPEEEDPAALEAEGHRLQLEKLQAALELQQAHSSRLAGEIGYLKEQQKVRPRPSEPSYVEETETGAEATPEVLRRIERIETYQVQAEVSQAIALGSVGLDEPEARGLREEIISVAPRYKDQMDIVFGLTDSNLARQMSEALTRSILADAKEARWQARHQVLVERKAATASVSAGNKRAATVSASGGVSAPPPKPKALSDLTADEADQWLKENVPHI